jgi:hypothetical protein
VPQRVAIKSREIDALCGDSRRRGDSIEWRPIGWSGSRDLTIRPLQKLIIGRQFQTQTAALVGTKIARMERRRTPKESLTATFLPSPDSVFGRSRSESKMLSSVLRFFFFA